MSYVLISNDQVIATGKLSRLLIEKAKRHVEKYPGQSAYLGVAEPEDEDGEQIRIEEVRLLMRFD